MICIIDYRATEQERNTLSKLGCKIIEVPKCNHLYPAIDGHVDIQIAILDKGKKLIVINKNLPQSFKLSLKSLGIKYIESINSLSSKYPYNIGLNAFINDNFLIHNLKFTDPSIINNTKSKNQINIKQGYAKCSILPVREKAIITNDTGIYNKLINYDFDILLLPPGDIVLPGFEYGFIGGTGGMINENTMAFFGNLDYYIHGDKVKSFLKKYNVHCVFLSNNKLIDRGSLLVL